MARVTKYDVSVSVNIAPYECEEDPNAFAGRYAQGNLHMSEQMRFDEMSLAEMASFLVTVHEWLKGLKSSVASSAELTETKDGR